MAIAVRTISGNDSTAIVKASIRSMLRLVHRAARETRNPSEKISQLGRRSSIRILPVTRS